jgi:ABC-type Na+ transport system ATPase subunit NatA
MTAAVEVQDLQKRYGAVAPSTAVTFSVAEGEVFGCSGTTARARRRRSGC